MKNLSKYFLIISIVCVLPLSVFAQTDASSSTSSSSFTTTPEDSTTTSNTTDANTTTTTQDTATTTQAQDTTTESTTTPTTTSSTTTGTTKSTSSSSYMDYLPYVLIAGSVILLISIIGILISSKKKEPQEIVQVTPQPTSAPETIAPPSEPVTDMANSSIPVTPQPEQPKPTLADIVNQTTSANPMYAQQPDQQSISSSQQPDLSFAQTVQTQPENQFNPYQVPQNPIDQQPSPSNIDITQSSSIPQQNPTQEQNYGTSDINTFQNKNTLSFDQPMVDQSVANDFFAPQNNMPTPEPKITPEEPTITIQNTPNEEVAQADFQNMINNEISKIPQQPNDQPIQPKVDETPSSELPQVPPTM